MFADDTKLYSEMSDVTDVTTLQSDITEMKKNGQTSGSWAFIQQNVKF